MQNWSQLWLQYRPIEDKQAVPFLQTVSINDFDANTPILQNALQELERGLKGMLGVNPTLCNTNDATLRIQRLVPAKSCGREQCHESDLQSVGTANSSCCVVSGSYHIKESQGRLTLSASDESGVLYGIFEILRRVALVQSFTNVDYAQTPDNELRMLNHWDNVDGSIERGYSGNSFFFEERDIVLNERIVDYARIVASVGINAVVVNNVN
ncbi:MAG: hypothetical protein LBM60_01310, partial [Clostridium sp.]|nr:hypothetical protein [Clostridium sp.]